MKNNKLKMILKTKKKLVLVIFILFSLGTYPTYSNMRLNSETLLKIKNNS
ncbi:MAG: hypothetical protein HeimC3_06420 [Candidatus Heimdallarchaeota archaeon LC_3]|nr:MAG: hypothetical protein HeimC3_06420 [Candidatus Heimdallarchaeota archaeon LC_3]